MPRNVSRSPHELVTYTLRVTLPKGFGPRAGRILVDRIESKAKSILNRKGPLRNQRPFLFFRMQRGPLSPELAHMADRGSECPGRPCCSESAPILILIRQLESAATELQSWRRGMPPYKCCQQKGRNRQENGN